MYRKLREKIGRIKKRGESERLILFLNSRVSLNQRVIEKIQTNALTKLLLC